MNFDSPRSQDDNFPFAAREHEQLVRESILLSPLFDRDSEMVDFPSEMVSPIVEIIEKIGEAGELYKHYDKKLKGLEKEEILAYVRNEEIVVWGPSEKDGYFTQYLPSSLRSHRGEEPVHGEIDESIVRDWRTIVSEKNDHKKWFRDEMRKAEDENEAEREVAKKARKKDSKVKIPSKKKKKEELLSEACLKKNLDFWEYYREQTKEHHSLPLTEKQAMFASFIKERQKDGVKTKKPIGEIPSNSDYIYSLIFEPSDTTLANWCALPRMMQHEDWYKNGVKKIDSTELAQICLFSIIEHSYSDNWLAHAAGATMVAGKAVDLKLNHPTDRLVSDWLLEDKNKSEKMAWIVFSLMRNVGIVKIHNEVFQKEKGGKTNPTLSVEFNRENWDSNISKTMDNIKQEYTQISRKPMLSPPRGHINRVRPGGELTDKLSNLFTKPHKAKLSDASIDSINALNTLQNTTWAINEQVLSCAEHFIGKAATTKTGFRKSRLLKKRPGPGTEELSWQNQMAILWARELVGRKNDDTGDDSRFWHAWRFDWRGRMYPRTNVLSPQGSDLSRALIQYQEEMDCPKEDNLDKSGSPTGLYWLKVYIVELFNGISFGDSEDEADKKASFNDRVKWVDANLEDLLRIAADWRGTVDEWWSDDSGGLGKGAVPFRRIAALFELKRVREEGVTNLPIQQDASCNWLQHTAMMVRDQDLAELANLDGKGLDDVPSDLYSLVVKDFQDHLQQFMDEGKLNPSEPPKKKNKFKAIFIDPVVSNKLLTRGMAKPPIIKHSYGSSNVDIRNELMDDTGETVWDEELNRFKQKSGLLVNIAKKLKEEHGGDHLLPKDHNAFLFELVKGYLEALERVAKGYGELKETVMALVSEAARPRLQWTTPLGFKVVNAGKIEKERDIPAPETISPPQLWNNKTTIYSTQVDTDPSKSKKKQAKEVFFLRLKAASGATPNFIHSIDGAHMQLSILKFAEKFSHESLNMNSPSLTMVHDCFGCHAPLVNILRQAVIDSFIEIHSKTPYEVLVSEYGRDFAPGVDIQVGDTVEILQGGRELGKFAIVEKIQEDKKNPLISIFGPIPFARDDIGLGELRKIQADVDTRMYVDEANEFKDKIDLKNACYLIG